MSGREIAPGSGGRGIRPAGGTSLAVRVLTWLVAPFVAAYLISKWAVRGGIRETARGIRAVLNVLGLAYAAVFDGIRAVLVRVLDAVLSIRPRLTALWAALGRLAARVPQRIDLVMTGFTARLDALGTAIGSLVARMIGLVWRGLGRVARAIWAPIAAGLRAIRTPIARAVTRIVFVVRGAAHAIAAVLRRVGSAIGGVLRRWGVVARAAARAVAAAVRSAARLVGDLLARALVVAKAAARSLATALRSIGHAIRILLARVGVAMRAAAHALAAGLRAVGHAIRDLLARASVALRAAARALAAILRPVGRALQVGVRRAVAALQAALALLRPPLRLLAASARSLATGLRLRLGVMVDGFRRGIRLAAHDVAIGLRFGWMWIRRLIGLLARGLSNGIRAIVRLIRMAGDRLRPPLRALRDLIVTDARAIGRILRAGVRAAWRPVLAGLQLVRSGIARAGRIVLLLMGAAVVLPIRAAVRALRPRLAAIRNVLGNTSQALFAAIRRAARATRAAVARATVGVRTSLRAVASNLGTAIRRSATDVRASLRDARDRIRGLAARSGHALGTPDPTQPRGSVTLPGRGSAPTGDVAVGSRRAPALPTDGELDPVADREAVGASR